jgi:hypothetical protein
MSTRAHPPDPARPSHRLASRPLIGGAALAVASLLGGACGGGDPDAPPTTGGEADVTIAPPTEPADPDGATEAPEPGGRGRPDLEPYPSPDTEVPLGPETGTDTN